MSSESSRNEEPCPFCNLLLDLSDERLFAVVKCPHCASVFRVRTKYGNYEFLEVLGRGGCGRVLRARRLGLENEVALKVLQKNHPDYEQYLLLLQNEAKFADLIRHPRIVRVDGLEEDADGVRLQMELMEGGSLHDQIISGDKFDEYQLLKTGLEVSEALASAFAKGVIHRDLKPANILFTSLKEAKLCDFGLAKSILLEEEDQETCFESHFMATPDYVAPETMNFNYWDFRSDVYGLGGALYHAFKKTPPYTTDGLSVEELRLLKQNKVILSSSQDGLQPTTATLINRMLEPDADDRFTSYSELKEGFLCALNLLS